jgi:hypothetical protein
MDSSSVQSLLRRICPSCLPKVSTTIIAWQRQLGIGYLFKKALKCAFAPAIFLSKFPFLGPFRSGADGTLWLVLLF